PAAPLSEWNRPEDTSSRARIAAPAASRQPSMLSGVMEHFSPEIQKLKGVAIGAVAALVRDMIKDKIPEGLRPHVQDMIHDVTHNLGGADVHGPVLPQSDEREPYLARHER